MHRKRILSRGDSQTYTGTVAMCCFIFLPSAMIFQSTPLPEMSMHRKEVHKSHVLQSQVWHLHVKLLRKKIKHGKLLQKDLSNISHVSKPHSEIAFYLSSCKGMPACEMTHTTAPSNLNNCTRPNQTRFRIFVMRISANRGQISSHSTKSLHPKAEFTWPLCQWHASIGIIQLLCTLTRSAKAACPTSFKWNHNNLILLCY